jgi:ABC-2 type transport system ATP-binding protein
MAELMIEVDNLSKAYGAVQAVERVSFQVARGEIVGFLGPNGAGKSTTMRILTTYLPATSGIAKVGGFDVMNQSLEVRARIGYLPESVPLYPEMRIDEYLLYRAKLKGVERKGRTARIEACMERCRIREVRRRLLGTLSKGYRQRVGLADALVNDPPILILDEPTSGLDPLQIAETLSTIKSLAQTHTVLLSTHILDEVEETCERVIIISRGTIGLDKKLKDIAAAAAMIVTDIKGPDADVAKALEEIAGVVSVQRAGTGDGFTTYEVRTRENADLREAIYHKVSANPKWSLRKLDLRQYRLKDEFTNVVSGRKPTTAGK